MTADTEGTRQNTVAVQGFTHGVRDTRTPLRKQTSVLVDP
jgi:hypothetical protein